MQLDPRITDKDDIFCSSNFEQYKYVLENYINQECYFAEDLDSFQNLDNCVKSILTGIYVDNIMAINIGFICQDRMYYYMIPASKLKKIPGTGSCMKSFPRYVPFATKDEFLDRYPLGTQITYLNSLENDIVYITEMLIKYSENGDGDFKVFFNNNWLNLDELFEFKVKNGTNFVPFGKELKEWSL